MQRAGLPPGRTGHGNEASNGRLPLLESIPVAQPHLFRRITVQDEGRAPRTQLHRIVGPGAEHGASPGALFKPPQAGEPEMIPTDAQHGVAA